MNVGCGIQIVSAEGHAGLMKNSTDDLSPFFFVLQTFCDAILPALAGNVLRDLRMMRATTMETNFVRVQAIDDVSPAAFLEDQCPLSNEQEVRSQAFLGKNRRELLNTVIVSQLRWTEDVFDVRKESNIQAPLRFRLLLDRLFDPSRGNAGLLPAERSGLSCARTECGACRRKQKEIG